VIPPRVGCDSDQTHTSRRLSRHFIRTAGKHYSGMRNVSGSLEARGRGGASAGGPISKKFFRDADFTGVRPATLPRNPDRGAATPKFPPGTRSRGASEGRWRQGWLAPRPGVGSDSRSARAQRTPFRGGSRRQPGEAARMRRTVPLPIPRREAISRSLRPSRSSGLTSSRVASVTAGRRRVTASAPVRKRCSTVQLRPKRPSPEFRTRSRTMSVYGRFWTPNNLPAVRAAPTARRTRGCCPITTLFRSALGFAKRIPETRGNPPVRRHSFNGGFGAVRPIDSQDGRLPERAT
jgi:hypothetical protein